MQLLPTLLTTLLLLPLTPPLSPSPLPLLHTTDSEDLSSSPSSLITELTPSALTHALSNGEYWLVQFGLPWDPEVIATRPALTAVAEATKGLVRVGFLPVDSPEAAAVAELARVSAWPELVVFGHLLDRVGLPAGAGVYGYPIAYPQALAHGFSVEGLVGWLIRNAPTRYADTTEMCLRHVVKEGRGETEIQEAEGPRVVFFHNETTPRQAALGARFRTQVRFYRCEGGGAEKEKGSLFRGVEENAFVVVLSAEGEILTTLTQEQWGDATAFRKLVNLLEEFPEMPDPRPSSDAERRAAVAEVLRNPAREISTWEQFDEWVVKPTNCVVAVAFFGSAVAEYENDLKMFQTVAKEVLRAAEVRLHIYQIDAEELQGIAKHLKVPKVPSLAFFVPITKDGQKAIKWFDGKFRRGAIRHFVTSGRMLQTDGLRDFKVPEEEDIPNMFGAAAPVIPCEYATCHDDPERNKEIVARREAAEQRQKEEAEKEEAEAVAEKAGQEEEDGEEGSDEF